MWVLAHYNGRELYNNGLDLCTVEEDDSEKALQCPIRRGWHYFVKEHNVSPLLPKVTLVTSQRENNIILLEHTVFQPSYTSILFFVISV